MYTLLWYWWQVSKGACWNAKANEDGKFILSNVVCEVTLELTWETRWPFQKNFSDAIKKPRRIEMSDNWATCRLRDGTCCVGWVQMRKQKAGSLGFIRKDICVRPLRSYSRKRVCHVLNLDGSCTTSLVVAFSAFIATPIHVNFKPHDVSFSRERTSLR